MVLSNVIVDVTIPRRSFVFGQSCAQVKIINLRRGLSQQPVPRFNVDLTAESCRSSLTDIERISGNDLKNIILSAKPKSCSLDLLPTWLLKNFISFLL